MEHQYLDNSFAEAILLRENLDTKCDYEVLMQDYIDICYKRLKTIKDSFHTIPTPYALGTVKTEKDKLRVEINTYKLLYEMYHNSLHPKGKKWLNDDMEDDDEGIVEEDVSSPVKGEGDDEFFGAKMVERMSSPFKNKFRDRSLDMDLVETWRNSHATILKNELETNFTMSYQNLIVSWLEHLSYEPIFFSGNDASYYFTSKIQRGDLVKNINPDASIQEQKIIHEYDVIEEQRLLQQIWKTFRAGRLDEADRLCRRSKQFWRAGILSGQELFHNSGIKIKGNSNRFLYLHSLLKLAESSDVSDVGKAVLGGIVGSYDLMKIECSTWYDELWAKLKANIYHRFSLQLLENTSIATTFNNQSKYIQSVLKAQEINETMEQMITSIRSKHTDDTNHTYMPPFELIQTYIITQQFEELIVLIHDWIAEKTKTNAGEPRFDHLMQHLYLPQLLRFGSHLILFLKVVGFEDIPEQASFILYSYIRHLTTTKQYRLVAFFCSKLDDISHQVYAKIISSLTDKVLIDQSMTYAQEFNLSGYELLLLMTQDVLNNDLSVLNNRTKMVALLDFIKVAKNVPIHASYGIINKMYRALFTRGYDCRAFIKRANELFDDVEGELQRRNDCPVDPPFHNELDEFYQHALVTKALDLYEEFKKLIDESNLEPPQPTIVHRISDELLYQLRLADYERQHEAWNAKKKNLLEEFCELVLRLFTIDDGGLYRNLKSFTPNRSQDGKVTDIDNDYLRDPIYTKLRHRSISLLAEAKVSVLSMDVRMFPQLQDFVHLMASHEYRLFNCFSKEDLTSFLEKVRVANMKAMMAEE
mmetsp:Transcript_385/g.703  ORF Transcript_385/g.703 Transcript_385/m.703 type:complete len:814 (+) Transcript_385:36-2477(+)